MSEHPTLTMQITIRPWVVRCGYAACYVMARTTPHRWHPALAKRLATLIARFGTVVTVGR